MTVDRKLIERVKNLLNEYYGMSLGEFSGCPNCGDGYKKKDDKVCIDLENSVQYNGLLHDKDCEWLSVAQAMDALLDDKVPY